MNEPYAMSPKSLLRGSLELANSIRRFLKNISLLFLNVGSTVGNRTLTSPVLIVGCELLLVPAGAWQMTCNCPELNLSGS